MAGVVVRLAVLTSSAAVLTGCGGDGVHVGSFDVSTAGRGACASFLDAVPDRVGDQDRRSVTGTEYAAAWGDPAIVLRCGVGKPKGFNRFSTCQRANGIDWFVPTSQINDQDADVRMTTVGRLPAVDVLVPARYRPPVAVMVDLEKAIKAHTKATTPCT